MAENIGLRLRFCENLEDLLLVVLSEIAKEQSRRGEDRG
jgi:hypothetical protein